MDWCEQVIEKSEEKTPFNTNSVFTPLVQSRKIGRLIRDYALQNCDNILEKVFRCLFFDCMRFIKLHISVGEVLTDKVISIHLKDHTAGQQE